MGGDGHDFNLLDYFLVKLPLFQGTARSFMKNGVGSVGSKEVAETWRPQAGLAGMEAVFLIWGRGVGWKPNQKQIALVRGRKKCNVSSFPLYCRRVWTYKWCYYHVPFAVYSKLWCFSVGKL